MNKLTASIFATLMLLGARAFAEDAVSQPRTEHGVTFVSGGIGDQGVQAIRQMERNYNTHLLFALQPSGEYLADIRVTILDSSGNTVLDAVSEGPYFLANLKPGRYRIVADNRGSAITKSLSVPSTGSVSESFYWRTAG